MSTASRPTRVAEILDPYERGMLALQDGLRRILASYDPDLYEALLAEAVLTMHAGEGEELTGRQEDLVNRFRFRAPPDNPHEASVRNRVLLTMSHVAKHLAWRDAFSVLDPDPDAWDDFGLLKPSSLVDTASFVDTPYRADPIIVLPRPLEIVTEGAVRGPSPNRLVRVHYLGVQLGAYIEREGWGSHGVSTTVPRDQWSGVSLTFFGPIYDMDGSPHQTVFGGQDVRHTTVFVRADRAAVPLSEVTARAVAEMRHNAAFAGMRPVHTADGLEELISSTIGLLIYMHCRNAELRKEPPLIRRKARRGSPKVTQRAVNTTSSLWTVGPAIGASIRASRAELGVAEDASARAGIGGELTGKGGRKLPGRYYTGPHDHRYAAPNQPGGYVSHWRPGIWCAADRPPARTITPVVRER